MSIGPATTPLTWVKTEIDFSLGVVRESIARFQDDPADGKALKLCPHQLHQVTGALRIVGLHGARQFSETIEGAFAAAPARANVKKAFGTIDRSVLALKEFVDNIADGSANVPLRLFPVYRELVALQGRGDISEKELFYPELTLLPPAHPDQMTIAADAIPEYAQSQRTRFQRGLVAWTRKPDDPRGLREMREAVDAMHQISAQLPEPRALWWIAAGLVDGLMQPPSLQWLTSVRSLCSRIDFEMRDLARQQLKSNEPLVRDLLYAVATCAPVTDQVKAVKTLFALDQLLPEPEVGVEFDMDWLQPALADMRSRLESAKDAWLEYLSGASKKLARFRELVRTLKARSDELGSHELVRLFDVIGLVCGRLPDPYPPKSEMVMLEMATAFLLAESVLDAFADPPADLGQQIVLINGWLLDAVGGNSAGVPPRGLRPDLVQQYNETQLRNQVAKEILHNLQECEQVLDAYARDPGRRDTLAAVNPNLRQVYGALALLRLEPGIEVLTQVQDMLPRVSDDSATYDAELMDWIAEGLSSLGIFLEPCLRGRVPDTAALDRFLARVRSWRARARTAPSGATEAIAGPTTTPSTIAAETSPPETQCDTPVDTECAERLQAPDQTGTSGPSEPAESSSAASETSQVAAPLDTAVITEGVNEELLAIYLEEADEVLSTIDGALPQCEAQPHDLDTLTVIRRGFHTLKGSGRMVGLTELGEVAWAIEQVMNRWLELREPATPALLELIRMGSAGFRKWVLVLKDRAPLIVDADAILQLAQRLKAGESLPEATTRTVMQATSASEPETVQISATTPEIAPPDTATAAAQASDLQPVADDIEPEAVAAAAEPAVPQVDYSALNLNLDAVDEESADDQAASSQSTHEEVVIGTARLSPTLYGIYVKEAEGHTQSLRQEFGAWQAHARREPSSEFHRAAHTLAGISRTAGIDVLAQLAAALEQWMPAAPLTANTDDVHLIERVIGTLADMVAAVGRREAPAAGEEEDTAALRELTTRLQSAPSLNRSSEDSVIIRAAATRAEQRVIRDDIDPQLLPIFLDEAGELLPQIGSDLREWKNQPEETTIPQSLKRTLHTLKGSARMAGAMRLGELTHLMESRVEAAQATGHPATDIFAELELQMDRLILGIEKLRESGGNAAAAEPAAVQAAPAASGETAEPAVSAAPAAPAIAAVPLPAPAASLRINADTLDRLINRAGESSIARSRIEGEVRTLTSSVSDLNDSIARLRTQLRELEIQADSQTQSRLSIVAEGRPDFDPLEFDRYTRLQELTRMIAETIHDALTIQQTLVHALDETDAALLHQSRINRELQQDLMRLRTVPFASIVERLHRVVRVSARDLGKKANLEIRGEQVELDRSVLDRIAAPLEHLLRNAVAHGIEQPAHRVAQGKAETGDIGLALRQESDEVVIVVSDDGAGLDVDKLRRIGIARGLLPSDREPTAAEITQVIFAPGLSTADEITELAGRGIGMDVVHNEVISVGGRIEIETTPGSGAKFTIYLPLTLAVTQGVLVRSGNQLFAISSSLVSRVLRLKPAALAELYARGAADADGERYAMHHLGELLGTSQRVPSEEYASVLLLRSGNQRVAVHVDELVKNQEIVIKAIGPQLARIPWMTGATVLGDGRIVLLINPVQLAQQPRAPAQAAEMPQTSAASAADHTIMIVDDSLTVRKVTTRLLEREGYRVLAAKDGIDALEQMNRSLPDVMLVDIEMPRMDGFDLTRNVRGDPKTSATPIIVISSRSADKHRNHAFELGVDAFIGKPFEEGELLSHIERCLEKNRQHMH